MEQKTLSLAMRAIAKGLTEAADLLAGPEIPDDREKRERAVLRLFDVPPNKGLSQSAAAAAFTHNGFEPQAMGAWARRGWVTTKDDRRYLLPAGRKRLEELEKLGT